MTPPRRRPGPRAIPRRPTRMIEDRAAAHAAASEAGPVPAVSASELAAMHPIEFPQPGADVGRICAAPIRRAGPAVRRGRRRRRLCWPQARPPDRGRRLARGQLRLARGGRLRARRRRWLMHFVGMLAFELPGARLLPPRPHPGLAAAGGGRRLLRPDLRRPRTRAPVGGAGRRRRRRPRHLRHALYRHERDAGAGPHLLPAGPVLRLDRARDRHGRGRHLGPRPARSHDGIARSGDAAQRRRHGPRHFLDALRRDGVDRLRRPGRHRAGPWTGRPSRCWPSAPCS